MKYVKQTIPLTAKEFRLKLMAIYHSDKKKLKQIQIKKNTPLRKHSHLAHGEFGNVAKCQVNK